MYCTCFYLCNEEVPLFLSKKIFSLISIWTFFHCLCLFIWWVWHRSDTLQNNLWSWRQYLWILGYHKKLDCMTVNYGILYVAFSFLFRCSGRDSWFPVHAIQGGEAHVSLLGIFWIQKWGLFGHLQCWLGLFSCVYVRYWPRSIWSRISDISCQCCR